LGWSLSFIDLLMRMLSGIISIPRMNSKMPMAVSVLVYAIKALN
jgi:hypothetical protein